MCNEPAVVADVHPVEVFADLLQFWPGPPTTMTVLASSSDEDPGDRLTMGRMMSSDSCDFGHCVNFQEDKYS